jgi:hypothetical protein
MLESSNSQSCKEFTLEGEFTVLHNGSGPPAIPRRTLPSPDYIDIYRCMVKYANCFTLNKSRPNPEHRHTTLTLIANPDRQLASHVPGFA